MDMYSATDGVPGDFHLVHLGAKALGGAGLVMTEMICVSAEARITPGCSGLCTDTQRDSWKSIVDFVHARSTAKIGVQLGHSGRKGSTRLMWEGIDEPVESGNWEPVGPSALPYGPGNQTPREISQAEMDQVKADFIDSARRAADAGFDLLEIHAAHGYLLSSFLSPISNRRTDEYGGSLGNRLRFPLEVFDAVRAVWPAEKPMTVRISATDWLEGGNTADDSIAIAQAFIEHGAAGIDVSTGQITKEEKPSFGRSYQTHFVDRIRQEVAGPAGVAVIAVGAISTYDDVNSPARRTLRPRRPGQDPPVRSAVDTARCRRTGLPGPRIRMDPAVQGLPAETPSSRTDAVRPRLSLLQEPDSAAPSAHLRWTPDTEAKEPIPASSW